MEIIERDGYEWMRGDGFPGWALAWPGLVVLAILGAGITAIGWDLVHTRRHWSDGVAIVAALINCAGWVLWSLGSAVVALFAIAGLVEWSTAYLIRSEPGTIIVLVRRFGGLLTSRREVPTASVSAVTTRMAGASGHGIVTEVNLQLDGRTMKVFRSTDPHAVEMLVIYLNAACGRHAGAGTAAHISAQWAALKERLAARDAAPASSATPPSGTFPSS